MAKPKPQWMPTHYTIKALAPSVTKAFVMAIIPKVVPTESDIEEALLILGMPGKPVCAYCGDKQTQWDHLRPVVTDSMPTGYISEVQNIVPSCGPCNGSKGAKEWRQWITSDAKKSPASRRVRDLAHRIERLEAYEQWRRPTVVDFPALVGAERMACVLGGLGEGESGTRRCPAPRRRLQAGAPAVGHTRIRRYPCVAPPRRTSSGHPTQSPRRCRSVAPCWPW